MGRDHQHDERGATRLEARDAARLAALLFMACGGLTGVMLPVLPPMPQTQFELAVGLAVLAFGSGVVIWFLPWNRWPYRATKLLIPFAVAMIAAFNAVADEPYLYSIYLLVAAMWLGLTQPRGTAIQVGPLYVLAYYVPLPFVHAPINAALAGAVVIPTSIVIAETVGWISERVSSAEAAVAQAQAYYKALVQEASECVVVLDGTGLLTYASPATERVLGVAAEDLVGQGALRLVHRADRPKLVEALRRWEEGAHDMAVEFRVRGQGRVWRWMEGIATNLLDDPDIGGIVLNVRDVTERRVADEMLAEIAYFDSLTGLPNRAGFFREMEQRLAARRDVPAALMLLDLDGFKTVNDSLGHAFGDHLLGEAGSRIAAAVGDDHIIGRLGGDEFVVLVEGDHADQATDVAGRIVASLREPFQLGDRSVFVTGSVGVVEGDPGESVGALLRKADLAMYEAKAAGRSRYSVFDRRLAEEARRRLDMEDEVRKALDAGDFTLHYQPIIDLDTGRTTGVEALLRWEHHELGSVSPAEFVPIAEEMGLIIKLGSWVLDEATRQAAEWYRQLGDAAPMVHVNLSAHQIAGDNTAGRIEWLLATHGLPAHKLGIEVTESVLADIDHAATVLAELKSLGVAVAIDDFGTGYSSLSYLHRLPIDTLKIDRSFLAGIDHAHSRAPLVEAIVGMAHSLDLSVVAEGVESDGQVALLRVLGCDRVQGFLYGRPETAAVTTRRLTEITRPRTAHLPAHPAGIHPLP